MRRETGRAALTAWLFAAAAALPAMAQWSTPPLLKPEIVAELPHDTGAFTQGLIWLDGQLYESTGLYGQSSLRELNPKTGAVLREKSLAPQYFAEGLTFFRGQLVQLTWKEGVAFRYPTKRWDRPASHFSYTGEGWGLTTLGQNLWMSDGSDTLFRRDAAFKVTVKLPVTLAGKPLPRLNELEGVSGKIVANVWYCDSIFIVDARAGNVLAVVDGSELAARSHRSSRDAVLNGIAYDSRSKLFFITGKDWPVLYKVRIPFAF
jgi:glutaminyl-peptide cyclotransferase